MVLKFKGRPGPNIKFVIKIKNNHGQYIVLDVRWSRTVSIPNHTTALVTKERKTFVKSTSYVLKSSGNNIFKT